MDLVIDPPPGIDRADTITPLFEMQKLRLGVTRTQGSQPSVVSKVPLISFESKDKLVAITRRDIGTKERTRRGP